MVYEFPSYLYCECEFGGKLYDTASYLENSTQLKLELADRITNEEWHSTLTESCSYMWISDILPFSCRRTNQKDWKL